MSRLLMKYTEWGLLALGAAEEGKEFIPLVIKAVVFASLQNPEEQEATESESPYHNEERINNLSSMMMTAERKCYDR
jgi:hypothetical protein